MRQLSVLSGILLVISSTTSANDWPGFRGPNRNDISEEKGLLKKWPEKGPKVAWKCQGIGIGFSSVAVVGKKVFTLGDVKDACFVFGIDRQSGEKLWNTKLGRKGGNYEGPRCTPAVDGDYVYALGQFGDLVCLKTEDGSEVWRKSLKNDFKGSEGGWNYTESPLVDGDKLVVTPGGPEASMLALDKKSGEVIWKGVVTGGGDSAGYSSIVSADIGGTRQYIQLMANGLVSFAAKDGKMLWRYGATNDRFAGNTANIPTPIVKGNQVFSAAGYGRGAALITITNSNGTFHVKEDYFERPLTNKHGGVVLVGDKLFGDADDSGRLWCADFKTGKIKWRSDKDTEGRGSISLTYADGMLYLRYANGYVALVDPKATAYKEVSIFKVPNGTDNCWAHPVVVDGKLFIREKDILWCYDVKGK
jgi:hypothetical protein